MRLLCLLFATAFGGVHACNTTLNCLIDSSCIADQQNDGTVCYKCDVSKSTSTWTRVKGTEYSASAGCSGLINTYPTPSSSAALAAMEASTLVGAVKSALGTSLAAAKTAYETAGTASASLKELAQGVDKTCARWVTFDEYFSSKGDTNFLDGFISAALDGTGDFADLETQAGRKEAIEKGCADQLLTMLAFCSIDGTKGDTVEGWDLAYAYYHGDTNARAPFGRANKRCKNYGTCLDEGTAMANKNVLAALTAGRSAAANSNAAAVQAAKDKFYTHLTVVYYQAALRYAYLLDADVEAAGDTQIALGNDHQAEGWAFWRVIEPIIAGLGEGPSLEAAATSAFYNVQNRVTGENHYCPLKGVLELHLPDGATAADMGSLIAADSVTCPAYEYPPPPGLSTGALAAVIAGGTVGGLIAIFVLYCLMCKKKKTTKVVDSK